MLSIHCTVPHGYFMFFYFYVAFFSIPFSPEANVSHKAVLLEKDVVAREPDTRCLMLLGRVQRWVLDYGREPFFILLVSQSSLYTDDKFSNLVGIRLQKEIWNVNMFPQSDINLKILLQGWMNWVYAHLILIYGKNAFGKSHMAQIFSSIKLGRLSKAFISSPGWDNESLIFLPSSHLVK